MQRFEDGFEVGLRCSSFIRSSGMCPCLGAPAVLRGRVFLEGRSAGRGCCLQVKEILDLAEQLVEDGTLDELAKVPPWIRPSWITNSPRSAD